MTSVASDKGNAKPKTGQEPVTLYVLSSAEITRRYPGKPSGDPRERWRRNRERNKAAGVDRFGRPLPRLAGTNPRAFGTNPRVVRGPDAA